ncbi:MAG TPA: T9SS type A sorting domain-containing protein [Flavobacteriales bacterium]
MLSKLHLTLLSFVPFPLVAQVHAGDPNGVIHTIVDAEIHPDPITFPGESEDTLSVDVDGNGVFDLRFRSGSTMFVDAISDHNMVEMRHAGVALAVSGNNGHAAKRLPAGTLIDGSLTWRAFDTGEFPNNLPFIGAIGSGFGGPFIYGGEEWLANGPVDTEGYLGVRIIENGETRYGWVGMISHVATDSVRLQIDDVAIQDGSASVEDPPVLGGISARPMSDGNVLLQGPLEDVHGIMVHDASGRLVLQVTAPVPTTIDLSTAAHGVHVLTLVGRSGQRSIKLVR